MSKLKFEYIWLDGNMPLPHIRGKTTVRDAGEPVSPPDRGLWVSTQKACWANGNSSASAPEPGMTGKDTLKIEGLLQTPTPTG